jgi:hypothetical protein
VRHLSLPGIFKKQSEPCPSLALSGHAGSDELPFFAKSGHSPVEFCEISPARNVRYCPLENARTSRSSGRCQERSRQCIDVLRSACRGPFIFLKKLPQLPAVGCQQKKPKPPGPSLRVPNDRLAHSGFVPYAGGIRFTLASRPDRFRVSGVTRRMEEIPI